MKNTSTSRRRAAPAALIILTMLSAAAPQFACAPMGAVSNEEQAIPRTHTSGDPLAACTSTRNRDVVKWTNQARKDAGQPPVYCSPELDKIALKHANDMCKKGYFSHTSKDGRTMEDRVNEAGFEFRAIGENIAMGHPTPAEVHAGWMDSPEHRKNIIRPVFSRLGVGYAPCNGQPIWVQNFAN
ncbi:CAP domain-containing protein [Bradymonas sediminis]|uniref:Uncharacterized protein n=1 Tax=Bradymonas sediminis TaxID=1548548 RepID=A0A2Z4FH24_9DELT|nr:CAP domain-containing protein [Bradymonas sediminis]AWV88292.1 hypothetical protein DN745_02625 [Bradymonas sediminis]TDP77415.1 uncharacterized protein YkwD [Bradymonas sediminis]